MLDRWCYCIDVVRCILPQHDFEVRLLSLQPSITTSLVGLCLSVQLDIPQCIADPTMDMDTVRAQLVALPWDSEKVSA